jgi:hypothetical protein
MMIADIQLRPAKPKTSPKLVRPAMFCAAFAATVCLLVSCFLFIPPLRDWLFVTSLWPWRLPTEVTDKDISTVRSLSRPGDVLVESNMHFWQWVLLSYATTHTSWVHVSLVDDHGQAITVDEKATELPLSVYLKWHSTKLALVRPPYTNAKQIETAIQFARSKRNTPYDPGFNNIDASCTGLVGDSLRHAGITIAPMNVFGHRVYAADSFFHIPGAKLLWSNVPITD